MSEQLHMKIAIRCLLLCGMWPKKITKHKLLYKIYFYILMTIYVVVVFSLFIELYAIRTHDFEEYSFLIGVTLLYNLGLVKLKVLKTGKIAKLMKKVQVTERNILKSKDRSTITIYKSSVKLNHQVGVFVVCIATTCDAMYWFNPIVTELLNPPEVFYDIVDNVTVYRPRPLIIDTWFPFDKYKHYWVSYTWQLIVAIIVPYFLMSCFVAFTGLLIFATGQIKILQNNVRRITKDGLKDGAYDDGIVTDNLRKCTVYHKAIINYVEELRDATRIFLLFDFLACGIHTAVIGFQLAVTPEISFKLFTTIIYLITMTLQLCIFYWFCNEILVESEKIAAAIWESEWFTCGENIKRSLLIFMLRAQKPLSLSVGPFYTVSTSTMMVVLRTGYSYAAVMRQFYNK